MFFFLALGSRFQLTWLFELFSWFLSVNVRTHILNGSIVNILPIMILTNFAILFSNLFLNCETWFVSLVSNYLNKGILHVSYMYFCWRFLLKMHSKVQASFEILLLLVNNLFFMLCFENVERFLKYMLTKWASDRNLLSTSYK